MQARIEFSSLAFKSNYCGCLAQVRHERQDRQDRSLAWIFKKRTWRQPASDVAATVAVFAAKNWPWWPSS